MIVRFTRLNPTHHRFEAIRGDGSRVVRELETRSFLAHDLAHFALETEAGLSGGFYGGLARGSDYDAPMLDDEARAIEQIVGPLQSATRAEIDAKTLVDGVRAYQEQLRVETPAWLTTELMTRVLERLRQLHGQWRATPFGHAMELTFRP